MWKSHYSMDTTSIGHYDLWHHTYSDQVDNNNNTSNSLNASSNVIDNDHHQHQQQQQIRQTPSVSLLRKKGLFIHSNPDYLHNRPFSPFSGYYEENDIYLGCEYDIFGSEPMIIPPTSSSFIGSTTTTNEQQHDYLSSSYNNDPFSIPSISNLSSSKKDSPHPSLPSSPSSSQQQQQLKRLREEIDTNKNQLHLFHHDKRQCTKSGILSKEISSSPSPSSSSFNHHSIAFMNDHQLEYC
ncbi:unnamed protein product [Cunninghamella blakesleeana]